MTEFDFTERETVWRPHPGPQEAFFALPDDIFQEAFYGGAVGGGKSWTLLMLPIMKGWYKHPKFRGIVFRKTFPQLEEYLIPEGKLIYERSLGADYNGTKHIFTFPSGATIHFSFIETKDDARDHDGSQYNFIGWDELTHFDEWVYRYLFRSLRSGSKDLPAVVRSTSNPGNIGHSWVRKRFIEPAKEGYKKLFDPLTKSYRIFIPSKIKDNPTLLKNNPNYINILNTLPEAERKAKIEGDWWTFAGQVFTEFREDRLLSEPENALHVIDSFVIPGFWPKVISVDWGYTHKTAIYAHAISPDARIYTYYEQIAHKTSIGNWSADLGRFLRSQENIQSLVLDPSAWKEEGHPKTIAAQIEEGTDFQFDRADNDRIGGKLNIHDMLRFLPRPKKFLPLEGFSMEAHDRVLRIHGVEKAEEYVRMFLEEKPESNLPRWQIFKNCRDLINVLPLCVYDEKHVEDVAKFEGDDSYDSARYGLKEVDRFLRECPDEFIKIEKLSGILQDLARTGDQTSFYRKMEKLEADQKSEARIINIFDARRAYLSKGKVHRAS